eukprot:TRINITY_DN7361_c0_g1_i1.p1 TRINITY_DN7361_c0_g1~~TRINITY_DN7361_c0_g1_i1.p1  ORF type:complete len:1606 (+),score=471.90 TRINITY_DN7361_c0_g1_i1:9-4826(+)
MKKKQALKLPGEYKKKKITSKLPPKTYTTLNASDIKILKAASKSDFVLDLNDQQFQLDSDEFLKECADLKELDLTGNALTKFINTSNLGKLKYLDLSQNNLTEVNFAGLKSLIHLTISRNARFQTLTDMSDLTKNLVYLDLSYCRITRGWSNLAKLKALKVLDLSSCKIELPASDFHNQLLTFVKEIPKLQYISFAGNPVENSIPEFNSYIIHELPELKYFNWDPVTKEEKQKAEKLAESGIWKQQQPAAVIALKKDNPMQRQKPPTNNTTNNKPVTKSSSPAVNLSASGNATTNAPSNPTPTVTPPSVPKEETPEDTTDIDGEGSDINDLGDDWDPNTPLDDIDGEDEDDWKKYLDKDDIDRLNGVDVDVDDIDGGDKNPDDKSEVSSSTTKSTDDPSNGSKADEQDAILDSLEKLLDSDTFTGSKSTETSKESTPVVTPKAVPPIETSKTIDASVDLLDKLLSENLTDTVKQQKPSIIVSPRNNRPIHTPTHSNSNNSANVSVSAKLIDVDSELDNLLKESGLDPSTASFSKNPSNGGIKPVVVGGGTSVTPKPTQTKPTLAEEDKLLASLMDVITDIPTVTVPSSKDKAIPKSLPSPTLMPHMPDFTPIPVQKPSWDVDVMEYNLEKSLGRGTYGESFLAKWHRSRNPITVKKLFEPASAENSNNQSFSDEMEKLMKLDHPSLVKVLGGSVADAKYVLFEHIPGVNLKSYIKEKGTIPCSFFLSVARTIAITCHYLHQQQVLHGAIKSNNIIVDKNEMIKLGDFSFMDFKDQIQIELADPQYMAPELLSGDAYAEKIDVYSYGIVLGVLTSGEEPFTGVSVDDIISKVTSGSRPELPSNAPDNLVQLIASCTAQNPAQRPDFFKIKKTLNPNDYLPAQLSFPIKPKPALATTNLPYGLSTNSNSGTPQLTRTNSSPSINVKVSAPVTPSTPAAAITNNKYATAQPGKYGGPRDLSTTLNTQFSSLGSLSSLSSLPTTSSVYSTPSKPPPPIKVFVKDPVIHPAFVEKKKLEQYGLLSKLVELFNQNVPALQMKAIKALYQALQLPGCTIYVARNEVVIGHLVSVLRQAGQIGKYELVELAIATLQDICQHPAMAESVAKQGAFNHLVNIVTTDTDPQILQLASNTMAVMCIAFPPNIELMRRSGALIALTNMLRSQNVNIQMSSVIALAPFLDDELNMSTFVQCGGFSTLLSMVDTRNAKLKLHIIEALCNFYSYPPAYVEIEPLKLTEKVIKMVQSPNALLRDAGLKSSARMCKHHDSSMLLPDEKIQIINSCIQILQTETNVEFLSLSAKILGYLLSNSAFSETYYNQVLPPALPHLAVQYESLKLAVLDLLVIILQYKPTCNAFLDIGGLPLLIKVLEDVDSRARQSTLLCLNGMITNQFLTTKDLLMTNLIQHLSSILNYIDIKSELALVTDLVAGISVDEEISTRLREEAVLGALVRILHNFVHNGEENDDILLESLVFALDTLTGQGKDKNRHVILDEDSKVNVFVTLDKYLKSESENVLIKVLLILGNLCLDSYGLHQMCQISTILPKIIDTLSSPSEAVVSTALRVILAITKQTSYQVYVKKADPGLEKLKALKSHPVPKISGAANKLVDFIKL